MKISGFTMVKNGEKLYYPVKESIQSILPLVDEFVVALGDCDRDDKTEEEILSIRSKKIKIIHTVWDLEKYPNGMENAHQTDIAKEACIGDWLLYLQADEVIHEKDLQVIKKRCEELLYDKEVEGLLFDYFHFWGDYQHYHHSHGWYANEIRIVRNDRDIHSWESAQSFRRIPNFNGRDYRLQEGTYKLKVASVDATIYHYGFVRPPHIMQSKKRSLDTIHKGAAERMVKGNELKTFDYGPLRRIPVFNGTHPLVMNDRISGFNWSASLNYSSEGEILRDKYKHEKLKYRLLSFVENKLSGGKQLFAFKNYRLLSK